MSTQAESFERNRPRLDSMSLTQLSVLFDEQCDQARKRGLWLWEFAPEFCACCLDRLPWLAAHGSGEVRR